MWSSPRSRARSNRACVRQALASLSTMAMMFLQRGGANPASRPLSSMAWSSALRAADSANRTSPLSFDGDKRGRMRQFYEAVVFDQKFSWSAASLRLLAADPRAIPYLGQNLPLGARTSACPILPWAPRLRRLMLPSDCVISIHFRDVSDCYYACGVDEKRLQRQVLGPRVPVSWFRNLDDASLDLVPLLGCTVILSKPRRYCQMAVAAVVMGDLNAVSAVEACAPSSTLVCRIFANSKNVAPRLRSSPFCHDR